MQAVLVDVDGTLVDSNYHHAIAWSQALHAHGYHVPVFDIHRRVGMGGEQMLDELIGNADPSLTDAWQRNFEALLGDVIAFDHAGDLLRACKQRGLTVVLATSSPGDLLGALRAKIGADDAIAAVVDADDVASAKPEPDVFCAALAKAGVDAEEAIMLGDSVWDVRGAARAGLRCVALETGGYGRAELEDAGAIAVYSSPAELLAQLEHSPLLS